jgi:hypothetical protein
VYRIDIEQGNIVDAKMMERLRTGMTPDQVRYVLGSPQLTDPFDPTRWVYVYRLRRGNGELLESRINLLFENGVLAGSARASGGVRMRPFLRPAVDNKGEAAVKAMGDVLGDLNARRGKVKEIAAQGDEQIVRASAPLAELFGYSTSVRSVSRGRASYTMEPERFEIVPGSVKEELLNR